jgi:hypothetical protein
VGKRIGTEERENARKKIKNNAEKGKVPGKIEVNRSNM